MRGLLIYPLNKDDDSLIGLQKKMYSQYKAFSRYLNMDLYCFGTKHIYYNDEIFQDFKKYPNWLNFLNYHIHFYNLLESKIEISDYDFVYLRYPLANPFFVNFLKKLRHNYWGKIFIEIPTYPYEKEGISIKRKILLHIDRIYRKRLKNYVNQIITHYGQQKIFDIPCYHMGNGVDPVQLEFSSYPILDQIKLLGVGNLSFYHGYDRLIEGLNILRTKESK